MKKKDKDKGGFTVSEGRKDKVEDFATKLAFDPDDIDDAVIHQPELYFAVSEQLVYAIDRRDALKRDIDVIEAETDGIIRETAEKREEKLTEPAIKKMVTQDDQVQDAYRKFALAKKQAALWEALQEAFNQRRYAVNKTADLLMSRMGTGSSVRDRMADNVRERAGEERQRRKRD